MGMPIKGEFGPGDTIGLVPGGALADWSSGGAVTLYTAPAGINSLVLTRAVARAPTGTQPLSFTIKINGTTWGSVVSLVGLVPGLVLPILQQGSLQVAAAGAQTITVTPLTAAAGTCTFDLQGYYS